MLEASRSVAGGVDIFGLAQRRMQWLEARQQVLAGNVANANTPGYAPQDVAPFDGIMGQFDIPLETTSQKHIPVGARGRVQKVAGVDEQSPDGNRVSLETQMEMVADTGDQQRLAANVYTAYKTMLGAVLGK
ncbi:flagellar basal-body rod protein FlgB [Acetobacter nitrogenifigens DSM 23921 = NBRC 105050]|uniref:Flagellar basal body rod protein FlgB n=1 Tax=Acetobacter nitrogenifigens DSM 23921 = NBRC 105050 TaxID=1120919 RepID=A0A511XB42_9PROT|nr:flagellar basal body protein [Acetobacter nitrogenifigens]GBQ92982.1 flagellar basal-body rod protein FlgB [Acetobacter nitrogenifigens DSM 23921 = NBRC 105050]GEN60184.1 flagellar basal body rod protein FlgB [Acetobacter nitrogenifigens DSM 23921 = NBRC 105050]